VGVSCSIRPKCITSKGYGKLCYGDLYHSYAADKEFTLSLRYVKYTFPFCRYSFTPSPRDFTKYRSLDGIYLANQYLTVDNEIDSENDIRYFYILGMFPKPHQPLQSQSLQHLLIV
jgi:hypothetical protein